MDEGNDSSVGCLLCGLSAIIVACIVVISAVRIIL